VIIEDRNTRSVGMVTIPFTASLIPVYSGALPARPVSRCAAVF
jgi:hypothetical protein